MIDDFEYIYDPISPNLDKIHILFPILFFIYVSIYIYSFRLEITKSLRKFFSFLYVNLILLILGTFFKFKKNRVKKCKKESPVKRFFKLAVIQSRLLDKTRKRMETIDNHIWLRGVERETNNP